MPAPLCRYFETRDGRILIPPDSTIACPSHAIEHTCNSIRDVESLVRRMQQIAMDEADREGTRHQIAWEPRLKEIRSNLIAKMSSSSISPYEREFIELWLQLSDQKKRDTYARLFDDRRIIAEALEYNRPRTPEELLGESF